jgi:hypothetical protein
MSNPYTTSVDDLKDILNLIDKANIQVQNIKTMSVMEWDQVSLIHKIQDKSKELYQNTRNI